MSRCTPLALALVLVTISCSEQPTAPDARRGMAPTPAVRALAPDEPNGPPDPHRFGPDTYRTGLFTGTGTPTGLSCAVSSAGRECTGYLASDVDQTRLDVTLQIPAGDGPFPLVALLHGWAGNKNNSGDIAALLLGDGYAVLRYSARGFGESWGQANLADKNVELRDLRSLIGQIVDEPAYAVDGTAVAITGASYGGGQSWLATLEPTFTSPNGTTVTIRTVVPIVPWTDLLYSLVPNGRPRASVDDGLGSPKLSYINGLYVSGIRKPTEHPDRAYPNYPDYLILWHLWINAVEPNDFDPVWSRIVDGLAGGRSIWWQTDFWQRVAATRIPVLEIQGLTDDLFPLPEAARMFNALRSMDGTYPIALYLGDIGHPRATNKVDEVNYVLGLMRQWLAWYLKNQGAEPAHVVYAAITRDRDQPFTTDDIRTAPTIGELATQRVVRSFDGPVVLVNPASDPMRGFFWDPFVMEGSAQLRLNLTPPPDPPVVATSLGTFALPAAEVNGGASFLVAGQPRIAVEGVTVAPRVQLDVRLIDVEPGPNGRRRLITRGTYTIDSDGRPIGAFDRTIPTYGNLFEVPFDHTLQLELTNLDTPYITPSRVPSATTITRVTLEVPIRPVR